MARPEPHGHPLLTRPLNPPEGEEDQIPRRLNSRSEKPAQPGGRGAQTGMRSEEWRPTGPAPCTLLAHLLHTPCCCVLPKASARQPGPQVPGESAPILVTLGGVVLPTQGPGARRHVAEPGPDAS